ncbi:hypothetical protein GYW21_06705 [Lactobacillus mellis]|nr:hypothetical protein [Bombilactobacillus mellis]
MRSSFLSKFNHLFKVTASSVNHSRLKSGACENCPSGATTTICLDTAIACLQVLRTNYQSLYGPQVARRTYYLDTR